MKLTQKQRGERYRRVVTWANRRYSHDGSVVLSVGGRPSTFSQIERLAFSRYLKSEPHQ